MLFLGHTRHAYVYDPGRADWTGRLAKPEGLSYGDCFYDLECCVTPGGIVTWTKEGLQSTVGSWTSGPVSANHNHVPYGGIIAPRGSGDAHDSAGEHYANG